MRTARYTNEDDRQPATLGDRLLAAIQLLDEHGMADAVDAVRATLRGVDFDAWLFDQLHQLAVEWVDRHEGGADAAWWGGAAPAWSAICAGAWREAAGRGQ